MDTVSVERTFDAPPSRVRDLLGDKSSFFSAVGFDVEQHGDTLTLRRTVAIKQIELTIRLLDEDVALGYEQIDGPFEQMETRYAVDEHADGSTLSVETAFESPTVGMGTFINEGVVEKFRQQELSTVDSILSDDSESGDSA